MIASTIKHRRHEWSTAFFQEVLPRVNGHSLYMIERGLRNTMRTPLEICSIRLEISLSHAFFLRTAWKGLK